MTGREKILGAFTPEGAPEIGVVASYVGIFIRDHYAEISKVPWWDATKIPDLAKDYVKASGLEWFSVAPCASRDERARQRHERRADGIWRIDQASGKETRLLEPMSGGSNTSCSSSRHTDPDALPASREQIDALIPLTPVFDRDAFLNEGRHEVAAAVREAVDCLLYSSVSSPLWSLYGALGYEGMMILMARDEALASYAGQRILRNVIQQIRMISALGADAVWIEECLTDQISPDLFRRINVPILRGCVETIRAEGMKSIYYYCGDPWNRLDAILDVGPDAFHFEESKKGFKIDIEDLAQAIGKRGAVFGNLDAVGVLQEGSEAVLRAEIDRQLRAGRKHGNRFVMSTGSPITPGTPVSRVLQYTNIVRELAGK